MAKGIKRTFVWALYTREKFKTGWDKWAKVGVTKSQSRAHNKGVKLRGTANRELQFKVVKVTAAKYYQVRMRQGHLGHKSRRKGDSNVLSSSV